MKKNFILFTATMLFSIANIFGQTQPGPPIACNSGNCTPPLSETCPPGGSTVITSFTNNTQRVAGNATTKVGAVYSFYNITTITGQQINATVTIDAVSNVSMTGANFNIDDDAATDQSGNSIASFFAPRITPSINLTTSDIRGYVQFTIKFYLEDGTPGEQYPGDYTSVPPFGLTGLNYIHYDIDGSTVGTAGWFRETGLVENVTGSLINADASTELVAYNYTDGVNWKGFAGSVCERTGVSRCAQVTAAASYSTPQTQISVRMGYDYNYDNTSYNSQPTRQYGSRFGCFAFPVPSTLPVKLSNFTVIRSGNNALLNWTTSSETKTDHFNIERSYDGITFTAVGSKQATGYSTTEINYQYTDPINLSAGNIYYRLNTLDVDGKSTYSKIVVLRLSGSVVKDFTVYPNPFTSNLKLELSSDKETEVIIRISDALGQSVINRSILLQRGANVIVLSSEIQNLKPGIHLLEIISEDGKLTQKIIKR
jgi:hypothetical protein